MALTLIPMTLKEGNQFIKEHHRHHKAMPGIKFALGAEKDDRVVGVVLVGRPVSRVLDDGWVLEVNRCCTDGTRNACSFLYGAAWRATRALGFNKLITYTLPEEGGASLRGAGWKCIGETRAQEWSRTSRPRVDLAPKQAKLKWEVQ